MIRQALRKRDSATVLRTVLTAQGCPVVRIRPVMRAKHAPSLGPTLTGVGPHAKGRGRRRRGDKRGAATEIYAETPVIVPIAVVAFNVPHKVAAAPAGITHTEAGAWRRRLGRRRRHGKSMPSGRDCSYGVQ